MILETLSTSTCVAPGRSPRARQRPADVHVRFWQDGDTEGIHTLYNAPDIGAYANVPDYPGRTADEWWWQYGEPSDGNPAYAVASHQDRLVGMQAYIPIAFLCDGTVMQTGKDEDTLIHPAYRGMGILDDMYQLLFRRATRDGVAVLWGFTDTAVRPLLRNGYKSIGRFDVMRADLAGRIDGGAAIAVRELVEPDDRCDRFSLEFGKRAGGFTPHLSARYLRWRLYDNPFRRYKVYAACENDRIIGLSAFKLEDGRAMGYVSELVAVSTASHIVEDVLGALLRPGLKLFRERGCQTVEARPSGRHPFNKIVRSVLSRHGFAAPPERSSVEFMVRPIGIQDPQFLNMDKWRISEIMREY